MIVSATAVACGTLLTEAPAPGNAFDGPLPGLSSAQLAAFSRGDAEFSRRFSAVTGLGPIFNNVSCISCHSADGRGLLENALHRIGDASNGYLEEFGGPQIQDKALPGAEAERIPTAFPVSRRLPPPVFGMGLIEATSQTEILSREDPDDRDGDGVSGRASWVYPRAYVPASEPGAGAGPRLGRFGRKAQVATLVEQVTEAYHQDMGITSDFQPVENRNPMSSRASDAADRAPDPEIPASTVLAVVNYVRMLAPPSPGQETSQRTEGRALFTEIGCAACHTPSMHTGPNAFVPLSEAKVELYSDLLLHDMGDALADNRPDGAATGREWRTTPLWGLRVMREYLDGNAFLLHDGRARSIDEAIRLHGGEAKKSRDAFAALTDTRRRALLDFVESR
jgi:CxxC motif-containing protein (DUF1111 family)